MLIMVLYTGLVESATWPPDSFFLKLLKHCFIIINSCLSNGCLILISYVVLSCSLLFLVPSIEEEISIWIIDLIHWYLLPRERNTFCCWNHQSWFWRISKIVFWSGRNCHPCTFHVCIIVTLTKFLVQNKRITQIWVLSAMFLYCDCWHFVIKII